MLGGDYSVCIELDYVTMIHILLKKLRFSLERNGEYQHYTEVTEGSHSKLSVTAFHEPRQALPHTLLPCHRGFLFTEGVSEYLQNFLQKQKIHNINCFK